MAQAGRAQDEFVAQTAVFEFARTDAEGLKRRLGGEQRRKFAPYLEGLVSAAHQGLSIGHTNQEVESDWLKLRRHNMRQLLKIVRGLEAVPEGEGTMMDNTLIVYSSCHGETQHSSGDHWPFLLIGDLGGTLRQGRYLHLPLAPHAGSRTINALYCTLLHAAGDRREHFNLDDCQKDLDSLGPIPQLLS